MHFPVAINLNRRLLNYFLDGRQSIKEELFSVQHQVPLIFAKDVDPLHVSIAPSGVNLMLSTSGNEILQLDLQYLAEAATGESRSHLTRAWSAFGSGAMLAPSGSVTNADIQAASPTPLATAFHSARVTCMDACPLVPLLATAAQDRELRSGSLPTFGKLQPMVCFRYHIAFPAIELCAICES